MPEAPKYGVSLFTSSPPSQGLEGLLREEKPETDERQVVDHVAAVDDSLRELLEVLGHGKVGDEARGGAGPALGVLDEPEEEEGAERQEAGHDLVPREAAEDEPEGDEGGAEEEHPEIAHEERLPLRGSEEEENGHMQERERQHRGIEEESAEELSQHDLEIGDGRGEQELDGAGADLFRERAHGQHGNEEQEDYARGEEHEAYQVLIEVQGLGRTPESPAAHAALEEHEEIVGEEKDEEEDEKSENH